ncbi:hypothetical protein N7519_007172 [Penicillium mononematosum]|uniref:uncharacterized protein n=1 Tax=Penicillium mononematosum TaxID=268346 RepID=UPI002546CDBE|nr:uncharacterized protein N7519_007172 [Penicillium mononematosum]KAJ6185871.1 hypothetical protein N7519_007172 [Penicillium mononematosum]
MREAMVQLDRLQNSLRLAEAVEQSMPLTAYWATPAETRPSVVGRVLPEFLLGADQDLASLQP